MKCHCGKALIEKTIATKTSEAGEHTIVETSRQALICAEHGVVVWDPIRPVSYPALPYQPWGIPYRPFVNPFVRPNTIRPGITWSNIGTNAAGGNYQS